MAKGDTIGVVAPSYAPRPAWLLRGVKALERAGYQRDSRSRDRRRAGASSACEDERRAENFMGMWLDPQGRRR